MVNKEKLYESFGELLYAVSMVDGAVQKEERDKLRLVLDEFNWGEQVMWSFDYEESRESDFKGAYERAFSVIVEHGPFREFYEFMDILEKVANASSGIDKNERKLIDQFKTDLQDAFMNNPNIR